MQVTAETTPHQIIQAISHNYYETISYKAAQRARAHILDQGLDEHRKAFTKLPTYIEALRMRDPGGYFHLAVNTNRKFQRCFFYPTAMQTLWRESRRFLALDGTFLTRRFIQTLLLAMGIDANAEATIITWGVVEGENTASWTYFIDYLKLALPTFAHEPAIIILDRDKGLESGLGLQNTQVKHVHCCYHLL